MVKLEVSMNGLRKFILDEESQSPKAPIDGSNTSSESEEERPTMSSMAGFRTKANSSAKGKQSSDTSSNEHLDYERTTH